MHAAVRLTNVRGSTKHQRQAQELRDDLTAGRVYLEMPMNNVLKMMLETFRADCVHRQGHAVDVAYYHGR